MSEALIEIVGLELRGYHGATLRERQEGQAFLFDLALVADTPGAETDDLRDTIDYRDVVACVRELSEARPFTLLEALAGAVADALLERFPVRSVRVRARKPAVVLDVPVEHTAVTVERARA